MRTRSEDKENKILDAASKVFAKYGYHNSKMSQIAEKAGVGAGSLYLYFTNKEALLNRVFTNLWKYLAGEMEKLVAREELNPLEKLEGMIDMVFDMFITNSSMAVVFLNEHTNYIHIDGGSFSPFYQKFLDHVEELYREGSGDGIFYRNLDSKVIRNFTFGGLRRIIHEWMREPQSFQLNMIRQDVKFLVKHGICRSNDSDV
jgi:TetR/AcrR family transcriptional regulator, fatty acid metabolism regulator protein